jgi:hypothetical protein
VEHCGDVLLGPYVDRKHSPKVRGKSRVPVRDNLPQEAKPGIDVLLIEHGDAWAGNGGSTWQKDGCLGAAMVDYGEDGILTMYSWEDCDQIHRYLLEWAGVPWGTDPVEGGFSVMNEDLVLLTDCIPFHILGDPVVHSQPGEMLSGLLNHLVSSWVTHSRMVMDQGHEVSLSGLGHSIDADGSCKFLGWKDDHVPVVLLPLVGGRRPRENVRPSVGLPRYVMDDEVVLL